MLADIRNIGMKPSHPGEFIKDEILDVLNLTVTSAARILGVRRATLSDLIHQKSALSAEMALRIEKAFGVSMEVLLGLQLWYDAVATRARSRKIAVKTYPGLAKFRAQSEIRV